MDYLKKWLRFNREWISGHWRILERLEEEAWYEIAWIRFAIHYKLNKPDTDTLWVKPYEWEILLLWIPPKEMKRDRTNTARWPRLVLERMKAANNWEFAKHCHSIAKNLRRETGGLLWIDIINDQDIALGIPVSDRHLIEAFINTKSYWIENLKDSRYGDSLHDVESNMISRLWPKWYEYSSSNYPMRVDDKFRTELVELTRDHDFLDRSGVDIAPYKEKAAVLLWLI